MPYRTIPEHEELLNATERSTLVTARPGRGKTTLAIRLAEKLLTASSATQKVLLLTFSRSAVHQIEQAAQAMPTTIRSKLWIATYHSFMWWLLNTWGRYNGLPKVLDVLGTHRTTAARMLAEQQGIPPEGRWRFYAKTFRAIPYEGFAPLAIDILRQSDTVARQVHRVFPTILVDEFQDTTDIQWEFIKLIGKDARLVCFADPDQLIYRWNGAKEDRLDQFVTETGATTRRLQNTCLRTAHNDLLTFAEAILDNKALPQEVTTTFGRRYLKPYPGPNAIGVNLKYIIPELSKSFRAGGGTGHPTTACATYSGHMAANIRMQLATPTEKGPTTYSCALLENDYDEAADELLLALAEYAAGGLKDTLERAFQTLAGILIPESGVTTAATKALLSPAQLFDGQAKPKGIAKVAYTHFAALSHKPATTAQEALSRGHAALQALCKDAKAVAKNLPREEPLARVNIIVTLTVRHSQSSALATLRATRAALTAQRLQDTILERTLPPRGITSSTLHKLKGRQFDYVIVITRSNDLLRGKADDEKDARRLLYVALTRARRDARILYNATAPAPLLYPFLNGLQKQAQPALSSKAIPVQPPAGKTTSQSIGTSGNKGEGATV